MDNDMKWFVIAMAFVMGLPMAGLALTDYQQSQCKLAAISAHMPVEEITKVCGKQ